MGKLKYTPYTVHTLDEIEDIKELPSEWKDDIKIVGKVLPFKTNNYVVKKLIKWDNVPDDPIFLLNFPQKEMLLPNHYDLMKKALKTENKDIINKIIRKIRLELNPHPAGQMHYNTPKFKGKIMHGIQHKYRETVLFFPKHGQNCHAFCTFCFRWPQFVKFEDYRFAMDEVGPLIDYIKANPGISDVLITGGDPLVMKSKILERYLNPLLEASLKNLKSIRIGTKSLSYWPYKYTTDSDSNELLDLFSRITEQGFNLAIMAHFNHFKELQTEEVKQAIYNIRQTGAQIRTQSPILRHINDKPLIWVKLLKQQVKLSLIPYYMFIPRNTGAQHYFSLPLSRAWKIFKKAYSRVSGLSRTIRGPTMSCTPGKVEITGVSRIGNERMFVLQFLQARNPDWVGKPFFGKYNNLATWMSDLKPLSSDKFFYESELPSYLKPYNAIREEQVTDETEISLESIAIEED